MVKLGFVPMGCPYASPARLAWLGLGKASGGGIRFLMLQQIGFRFRIHFGISRSLDFHRFGWIFHGFLTSEAR